MPTYRVQVADRETGAESIVTVEAPSERDASLSINPMRFLLGRVERMQPTPPTPAVDDRVHADILAEIRGLRSELRRSKLLRHPRGTIAWGIVLGWLLLVAIVALLALLAGVFTAMMGIAII